MAVMETKMMPREYMLLPDVIMPDGHTHHECTRNGRLV